MHPLIPRATAACLGAALLLAGCAGGDRRRGAEARAAVEAFDAADAATLARLNEVYRQGGDGAVSALAPLLADADRDRRWAAVYLAALLADTEAEAEILDRALEDPDPVIRILAAGSLAGLGRVEALPVLVYALEDESSLLPFPGTGRPARELALEALTAYTGESFSTPRQWRHWMSRSIVTLRWNGQAYVER